MNVNSGHVHFRTRIVYTTTTARCATSTFRQLAAVPSPLQALRTSTTTSTTRISVNATTTVTVIVQDALAALSAAASSNES